MATNDRIYIGSVESPTFVFDETQIERINFDNSVDVINNELSADTLEVNLFYDDENGTLRATAYATPLFYYSENRLVSKYYISKIERTGTKRYKIYSTSLIGLIEKENFYGGFYTGQRFQDVLNDILFTNGVDMSKYNVYNAMTNKSGSYGWGSKLLPDDRSIKFWGYRIHSEFSVVENQWSSTSDKENIMRVGGYYSTYNMGDYSISLRANRDNSSSPTYWNVEICYYLTYLRTGRSEHKLYGNGSRFTVDIDPVRGVMSIHVDYVQYDNPSVTGEEDFTLSFSRRYPSQTNPSPYELLDFTYAPGGARMSNQSTTSPPSFHSVIFYKQQVFDQYGTMVMDAVYAYNQSENKGYVINVCNGMVAENNYLTSVGNADFVISDFARFERDKELSKSIIFSDNVADLPIRGWIKMESRRDALHELLFAENVNMLKTENGEYLFTALSKDSTGEIEDGTIYDNSREEVIAGAKKISVTEHSYETSGVSSEKIFDNSSSVAVEGEYLAMFDKAPIFGTPTASGITIKKFNCNVAIVTGRGTITGTPYRHSKSVIQYINNLPDGSDVSVSNIGIITSANSDNVMNKLKAYYSGNLKKISNDIVYKGQRCGLIYDFKNLFRNSNSGYLSKISSIVSSFVRAMCEFISGYVPPVSGGYVNFVVKTYNQSWTVPTSVRTKEYPNVRINIIGKGHEGTSGGNGTAGGFIQEGSGARTGADGGSGGAAGTGGVGGNIYSVTVDVTNVARIDVSNTGYNTIVKTYNDGGNQIASYSSASGNAIDTGFTNIFDGTVYARRGLNGVAGAAGGKGGSYSTSSHSYVAPGRGGSVGSNSGGTSPSGITLTEQTIGGTSYMYNSFGGGGGAAYGRNGGNGREQWRLDSTVHTQGGAGANALVTSGVYTEYGSGGFGGNGGGGGGGGAARYSDFAAASERQYYSFAEDPGSGGTGSAGTSGIDGCIIVYY